MEDRISQINSTLNSSNTFYTHSIISSMESSQFSPLLEMLTSKLVNMWLFHKNPQPFLELILKWSQLLSYFGIKIRILQPEHTPLWFKPHRGTKSLLVLLVILVGWTTQPSVLLFHVIFFWNLSSRRVIDKLLQYAIYFFLIVNYKLLANQYINHFDNLIILFVFNLNKYWLLFSD